MKNKPPFSPSKFRTYMLALFFHLYCVLCKIIGCSFYKVTNFNNNNENQVEFIHIHPYMFFFTLVRTSMHDHAFSSYNE